MKHEKNPLEKSSIILQKIEIMTSKFHKTAYIALENLWRDTFRTQGTNTVYRMKIGLVEKT